MNEYPKVSPEIIDPVNENLKQLAALFPAAVKDGQLDLDALKAELGQFEEVGEEKYQLNWPGKQAAKQKAFEKSAGRTLKFIPEESKNPETTENIFIEGDNLEALQLLRKNYYGAIKMIYIDPPYNTGNDFVYKDNFTMSQAASDQAEGNVSEEGERLIKNSKDSGRYHSNWLNMMYPRLKIARELLTEDGVIFISIDDGEQASLKRMCDEIFGEENFISNIVWQKRTSPDARFNLGSAHDYIAVYARSLEGAKQSLNKLPLSDERKASYKNPDNDPRGVWASVDMTGQTGHATASQFYTVKTPSGAEYPPPTGRCWALAEATFKRLMEENRIWFGVKEDSRPRMKKYLSESEGINSWTWWPNTEVGHNQEATKEVKELMESGSVFDSPKPTKLLGRMIQIGMSDCDIILDFFAGSATTAHAVMQLNAEDDGNRKFIMVQLPEACDEKSEAFKAGYKTIAEISKERIRRAGEKILADNADKEGIENLDIGFKVFKIGDTNINWLKADLQGNDLLESVYKNVSNKDKLDFTPTATDLDVVYEIMLRQADIPLSASVEKLDEIGARTYLFADSYLVCLEESITQGLINELAEIEPLPIKFVFRDSAFGDDIALKDKTFRSLSALIDRNTGVDKQSYTVEFI